MGHRQLSAAATPGTDLLCFSNHSFQREVPVSHSIIALEPTFRDTDDSVLVRHGTDERVSESRPVAFGYCQHERLNAIAHSISDMCDLEHPLGKPLALPPESLPGAIDDSLGVLGELVAPGEEQAGDPSLWRVLLLPSRHESDRVGTTLFDFLNHGKLTLPPS